MRILISRGRNEEQQKMIRRGWFSWLTGFVDFGEDGGCLKPRQWRISK